MSKRLILIDGSAYLFRAFHALPPLSNVHGEPTGALFGVVNMLRSHLAQKPDYLAFVMDPGGKNFRHELYPEYKANRPPMPDELRAQIEPMLAIVRALGIPVVREPKVEADDVIGTLARQAESHDLKVTISTGDKDLAQLVDERVELVNTMTGSRMNAAGVVEKFGVRPDQIVDFLALMGDKVDNIPGVDKCGEKTAAKWLNQYDSLVNLTDHAHEITGKIGENLRAALPKLPLSQELARIRCDLPLPMTVESLTRQPPDVDALKTLYARYEFRAALKELEASTGNASSEPAVPAAGPIATPTPKVAPAPIAGFDQAGSYECVRDRERLDVWLDQLRTCAVFAFDTETTSLDAHQAEIVGVSFAIEPKIAAYVPLAHTGPGVPAQLDRREVLDLLKPILESETIGKIGQHGKYDMHVLARYDIEMRGYRFDTMLESYVLNSTASRHDMDSLSNFYLNYKPVAYEEVAGKGAKQISFADVDLDTATRYAAEDADVTLRLHQTLHPRLAAEPKLLSIFSDIEMPLVPVLRRMEQNGILIDAELLKQQTHDMRTRMSALVERAYELVGHRFSLDSPKQLQAVLYDELKLPVLAKTPSGQPSTNEDAISDLAEHHELPRLILDYRGLAKLVSTYTDKLPLQINADTKRVHTSFHQAIAQTGRLSSTDPNLQNIPIRTEDGRRIRKAFIAPPGWKIVAADYSQIELRIMAHLSEDEGLLRAFREGIDVHRATAAEVFGIEPDEVSGQQRRAAKAINFGLMYGMGAFGLARQLDIGRKEANDYISRYFSRYPGVRTFMDSIREKAKAQGYVETVFGRRLYLNEIHSRNAGLRAGAERAAINAPMQGTAADIIKRAMLAIDQWLADKKNCARMLLQVHDELVFEIREDQVDAIKSGLIERMDAAAELLVPLEVDVGVGENWDEAH
ncbi:DNA polymerase I [Ahniella affigens]|uniref:DNA polymerase I n=1 Tax=Ahniella affigens TaxID=2021234 RepID=A0A2P1PY32_9GAMM|nr:DNA polymerase I [Ahniella affigens]AVP99730.1 DNA polymerase I [Ahniella affigens]